MNRLYSTQSLKQYIYVYPTRTFVQDMIISIDDTDSRELGMCTTYVGNMIANKLSHEGATIRDMNLIRLNPAAKHKTRGNASVAIHFTNYDSHEAFAIAENITFANAQTDDDMTNPAVLLYEKEDVPDEIAQFTDKAIHELLSISEAADLIEKHTIHCSYQGNGRGRIGALAAMGAQSSITDWTYECINYRSPDKWGSERRVDYDSIFTVSDAYYPQIWDTVDKTQGYPVAIPRTPCPILYGIRGESPYIVEKASEEIDSEQVYDGCVYRTNQGTDVHLQDCHSIEETTNNKAYRLQNVHVSEEATTIEGGHVFITLEDMHSSEIEAIAFEPTKQFRNKIRNLRVGDVLDVCGEITDNSVKIEKFQLKSQNKTKKQNPECPQCGNSMSSAGRNQGFRCKSCKTHESEKETVTVDRDINVGWHEVPPCARRHISKPLIRSTEHTHEYR